MISRVSDSRIDENSNVIALYLLNDSNHLMKIKAHLKSNS